MSLESRATLGAVDSINTSGSQLVKLNSRAFQEGDEVFVVSENAYYTLQIDKAYVVDNAQYVTARGLSGGQWAKSLDVDILPSESGGGIASLSAGADIALDISTPTVPIISALCPKDGTALTNADQTLQPATDKASRYRQVTTLTANRSKTLGTTSAFLGQTVFIQREDTGAFTLSVINGGAGAGTLFTFEASPTEKQLAAFQFDGTNWALVGFYYIVRG